jgi:hypothetical protein
MNRIHALHSLREVGRILVYQFQSVDALFQAEHALQAQFIGQDKILRVNGSPIGVTGSLMRGHCELMIHAPDDRIAARIRKFKKLGAPHRECDANRRALLALKTKNL